MKKIEHFIWYKILYPICNALGLNLYLNLFRHWLGVYPRYGMSGRCQWCGHNKCISWKEVQAEMKSLQEKYKNGLV